MPYLKKHYQGHEQDLEWIPGYPLYISVLLNMACTTRIPALETLVGSDEVLQAS